MKNLMKFKENLVQEQKCTFSAGVFRVVDAAFSCSISDEVDWESFTLQDAMAALDYAKDYVGTEVIDEGYGHRANCSNAIHAYLHNVEIMYAFKKLSPIRKTDDHLGFF
ncbi:hypothetical protein QP794_23430 [Paenibacillus sp. UMB7766-LJ446]|uniref:hypothetical protein n=1 Tax=Paenibacillus TaxID=44249 RepID=UPI00254E0438|nr:hypothetical protein [Paenibacillus sp. UMB7766-LJ446]MDK8193046.1 hypothetical protein [Paenibacillus sp. UMB7766-LJ446]